MAKDKITHIAHYEVGYRPRSHWETKEFPTRGEADKFVADYRDKHIMQGAWAETKVEWAHDPIADRCMGTVHRVLGW